MESSCRSSSWLEHLEQVTSEDLAGEAHLVCVHHRLGRSRGHDGPFAAPVAEEFGEELHRSRARGRAAAVAQDRREASREIFGSDALQDAEHIERVLVVRARGSAPLVDLEHLRHEERAGGFRHWERVYHKGAGRAG